MSKALVVVETTLPVGPPSEQLVAKLLEERLAACANWERVRSAYWWEGRIENTDELHVSFKTSPKSRDALLAALRRRHPYDVPFITWHHVDDVDQGYAVWVDEETSGGSNTSPSD